MMALILTFFPKCMLQCITKTKCQKAMNKILLGQVRPGRDCPSFSSMKFTVISASLRVLDQSWYIGMTTRGNSLKLLAGAGTLGGRAQVLGVSCPLPLGLHLCHANAESLGHSFRVRFSQPTLCLIRSWRPNLPLTSKGLYFKRRGFRKKQRTA